MGFGINDSSESRGGGTTSSTNTTETPSKEIKHTAGQNDVLVTTDHHAASQTTGAAQILSQDEFREDIETGLTAIEGEDGVQKEDDYQRLKDIYQVRAHSQVEQFEEKDSKEEFTVAEMVREPHEKFRGDLVAEWGMPRGQLDSQNPYSGNMLFTEDDIAMKGSVVEGVLTFNPQSQDSRFDLVGADKRRDLDKRDVAGFLEWMYGANSIAPAQQGLIYSHIEKQFGGLQTEEDCLRAVNYLAKSVDPIRGQGLPTDHPVFGDEPRTYFERQLTDLNVSGAQRRKALQAYDDVAKPEEGAGRNPEEMWSLVSHVQTRDDVSDFVGASRREKQDLANTDDVLEERRDQIATNDEARKAIGEIDGAYQYALGNLKELTGDSVVTEAVSLRDAVSVYEEELPTISERRSYLEDHAGDWGVSLDAPLAEEKKREADVPKKEELEADLTRLDEKIESSFSGLNGNPESVKKVLTDKGFYDAIESGNYKKARDIFDSEYMQYENQMLVTAYQAGVDYIESLIEQDKKKKALAKLTETQTEGEGGDLLNVADDQGVTSEGAAEDVASVSDNKDQQEADASWTRPEVLPEWLEIPEDVDTKDEFQSLIQEQYGDLKAKEGFLNNEIERFEDSEIQEALGRWDEAYKKTEAAKQRKQEAAEALRYGDARKFNRIAKDVTGENPNLKMSDFSEDGQEQIKKDVEAKRTRLTDTLNHLKTLGEQPNLALGLAKDLSETAKSSMEAGKGIRDLVQDFQGFDAGFDKWLGELSKQAMERFQAYAKGERSARAQALDGWFKEMRQNVENNKEKKSAGATALEKRANNDQLATAKGRADNRVATNNFFEDDEGKNKHDKRLKKAQADLAEFKVLDKQGSGFV